MADIGLIGLAVMGQNLALNIAEKGFSISVFNRTYAKTVDTEQRSQQEGEGKFRLKGFEHIEDFVASLQKPRKIIMLVQAGAPVDSTIKLLLNHLEQGDIIIDGGNEWYENTERRAKEVSTKGILYVGMGVSGGEEGARYGPSLMPGGPHEAYLALEPILKKIAAQVDDGPCVTYIGPGGSGNYVKMIHNGIEYGDMELIAEVYDLLKNVGGLTNDELHQVFSDWNKSELQSFLIEITAQIFKKRDEKNSNEYLVDYVLDKSGSKGTGKWTIQECAERSIPAPTMAAALDARYMSSRKEERLEASKILAGPSPNSSGVDKDQLINDLKNALYSSKICSYTQGMNVLREASNAFNWNLDLGAISRIWKGGCIIRAIFLDRIKSAYDKNKNLASLLVDDAFAKEIADRQESWRRVNILAINQGVPVPALAGSLAYYDSYRRDRLPANLIQAQRDFFGAHTYQRVDEGTNGQFYHSHWAQA
jgi:6-phosphogluconate dehydrogenase